MSNLCALVVKLSPRRFCGRPLLRLLSFFRVFRVFSSWITLRSLPALSWQFQNSSSSPPLCLFHPCHPTLSVVKSRRLPPLVGPLIRVNSRSLVVKLSPSHFCGRPSAPFAVFFPGISRIERSDNFESSALSWQFQFVPIAWSSLFSHLPGFPKNFARFLRSIFDPVPSVPASVNTRPNSLSKPCQNHSPVRLQNRKNFGKMGLGTEGTPK